MSGFVSSVFLERGRGRGKIRRNAPNNSGVARRTAYKVMFQISPEAEENIKRKKIYVYAIHFNVFIVIDLIVLFMVNDDA